MSAEEVAILRGALERLDHAGPALRARSAASVARSLSRALALIANPELPLGHAAREQLPVQTGLSLPMVVWALDATLRDAATELDALARLHDEGPEGASPVPGRLGALVLAGNVFTACIQPLAVALISRTPVCLKASSRDDLLPRLVSLALSEVDNELADACTVISFPGGSTALEDLLLSRADVVSVFGSDRTLRSLAARTPATTLFMGHGHGLGVAFVGRAALSSDGRAAEAAAALALDVVAYDQRGCLSPHAVWIERGAPVDGARFSRMLAEALAERASELPRGPLPTPVGAAQIQWRGVGAARGALIEGEGYAVAYEANNAMRTSPGWRNVQVVDADDVGAFAEGIAALGVHLKCIGVAGDDDLGAELDFALPPPLHPRIVPLGQMQRPRLDAFVEGRHPFEGWRRYRARG